MEVVLLGTGSPRGWPEPGCRCASCAGAVARRLSRAPTSALVDEVLLLDPTPEVARRAAGAGRDLSRVRTVLLSGQHEPVAVASSVAALAADGPVEVLGTEAAVAPYALHARAQVVPVTVGDVLARGEHVLRCVGQGESIAWDIHGPGRALWAPGAGPVEGTPEDAEPYDVVLLGAGPALVGQSLGRLRRSGSVVETTDVILVAIGHDHGHPDALAELLSAWGASVVADGTVIRVGDDRARPRPALRGRTLVLGGVRSGKSALAEQLLAAQPSVVYVATGGVREDDPEWRERVAAHVARRPAQWRTVESTDLAECLRTADAPLLIDCLGTWLTARLDHHGVWKGAPTDAVEADIAELLLAWRSTTVPVVAVSNEVGSGVVPASASGRLFRDLLGRLNAAIAAESESVLLTVAGIPVPLRVRMSP